VLSVDALAVEGDQHRDECRPLAERRRVLMSCRAPRLRPRRLAPAAVRISVVAPLPGGDLRWQLDAFQNLLGERNAGL
jgi:hypothetical protein